MYKTYYKILMVLLLTLTSCNKKLDKITHFNDYNAYLELDEDETLQAIQGDYQFWKEKLEKEPNQFPYLMKLAASQSQLFHVTGNIDYLIDAEKNLLCVNERTNYNKSGYLRALARNYVSQHKFKEALDLLKKAETIGENLKGTQKMLFDVYLELGNTKEAKHYLTTIKDFNDFDYLIRLAKWNDHQGHLDTAIKYMEKALSKAESSNLKGTKQWIYTNIADFYGHAGEIKKSYSYYLKALELNPNDAYSKKGIAWIVYSHEHNPEEALRILNKITEHYNTPAYYLLKAQIADYMGNKKQEKQNIDDYLAAVKNVKYGDMYNKYNVELFTENLKNLDSAFTLAQKEIHNRPTAQSYDLLAWTYYKKGDVQKALEIVDDHVVGKTFEPNAMYHIAKIYKANGENEKAQEIKTELKESTFELGPLKEKEILKI